MLLYLKHLTYILFLYFPRVEVGMIVFCILLWSSVSGLRMMLPSVVLLTSINVIKIISHEPVHRPIKSTQDFTETSFPEVLALSITSDFPTNMLRTRRNAFHTNLEIYFSKYLLIIRIMSRNFKAYFVKFTKNGCL